MNRTRILALAAAALVFAGTASAQSFQKPEDAIKYRRSALTVLGAHYAPLAGMAQGRVPYDAQAAARHADVVLVASTLPWTAFLQGTHQGETRAKPEIWSEPAKFRTAAERMQGEMQKFAAAAKTGNADNLKAAFSGVSPTCKACHDDFRKE